MTSTERKTKALKALARVVEISRTSKQAREQELLRQAQTVRRLAQIAQSHSTEEAKKLREHIQSQLLGEIDPLFQSWNVFRLFNLEYDEPRWTQWLASILRPENGRKCSHLIWEALCAVIARAARESSPTPNGNLALASADDWEAAARLEPKVEDEQSERGLGQIDLLIRTGPLLAGIENKLWDHWHDGPSGKTQSERYRELVEIRCSREGAVKTGLVLLSCNEELQRGEDFPEDYIYITWRQFGREIRKRLATYRLVTLGDTLRLWPVVLTLISIEQDLLGFYPALLQPETTTSADHLRRLRLLSHYLREDIHP